MTHGFFLSVAVRLKRIGKKSGSCSLAAEQAFLKGIMKKFGFHMLLERTARFTVS